MKQKDYKKKRAEIASEVARLRAEVDKAEMLLAALDMVWKEAFHSGVDACDELSTTSGPTSPIPTHAVVADVIPDSVPIREAEYPLSRLIAIAVRSLSGSFGVKEVEAKILADTPTTAINRSTIAGRLKKMADPGALKVDVAGSGRRQSTYSQTGVKVGFVGELEMAGELPTKINRPKILVPAEEDE